MTTTNTPMDAAKGLGRLPAWLGGSYFHKRAEKVALKRSAFAADTRQKILKETDEFWRTYPEVKLNEESCVDRSGLRCQLRIDFEHGRHIDIERVLPAKDGGEERYFLKAWADNPELMWSSRDTGFDENDWRRCLDKKDGLDKKNRWEADFGSLDRLSKVLYRAASHWSEMDYKNEKRTNPGAPSSF